MFKRSNCSAWWFVFDKHNIVTFKRLISTRNFNYT